MNNDKFSFRKRAKSFSYAFRGIADLFRCEHNARIHAVVGALVVAAGFFFSISPSEWTAITICIGGVFAAEAFNSAIEALADMVSKEHHPLIRRCKDTAAGAVLLFVLGAVVTGLIIFIPKLSALLA